MLVITRLKEWPEWGGMSMTGYIEKFYVKIRQNMERAWQKHLSFWQKNMICACRSTATRIDQSSLFKLHNGFSFCKCTRYLCKNKSTNSMLGRFFMTRFIIAIIWMCPIKMLTCLKNWIWKNCLTFESWSFCRGQKWFSDERQGSREQLPCCTILRSALALHWRQSWT